MWVYFDGFHTEHNIVSVDQPTLGLPLSMYLDQDSYADYIAGYKTFMVSSTSLISTATSATFTTTRWTWPE